MTHPHRIFLLHCPFGSKRVYNISTVVHPCLVSERLVASVGHMKKRVKLPKREALPYVAYPRLMPGKLHHLWDNLGP